MNRRILGVGVLVAVGLAATGVMAGQSLTAEPVTPPRHAPVPEVAPEATPDRIMAALSTPCGIAVDCFDSGHLHVAGSIYPLDRLGQSLTTVRTVTETVEVPVTVTEYVDVPGPTVYVDRVEYLPAEPVDTDAIADQWFQNGLDQGYENGYADALEWVAATTPEPEPEPEPTPEPTTDGQ